MCGFKTRGIFFKGLIFSSVLLFSSVSFADQVDNLIELFQKGDNKKKVFAAKALSKIGDKRAIPPLIETLSTKNNYLRSYMTQAITAFGGSAVPYLINACTSENPKIRGNAANTLGKIEDKISTEPLIKLLNDKSEFVRKSVIIALSHFEDKRAMTALSNALESESVANNRSYIVKALGEYKSKAVIRPLSEATKDSDPFVRKDAARSLGKTGLIEAIPYLTEALADKDEDVRQVSSEALARLGNEGAFQKLIEEKNLYPVSSNTATAEWGDLVLEKTYKSMKQADMKKVLFSHRFHRVRFKCKVCHETLFKMKRGGNEISMSGIIDGKSCGKCHNDTIAFSAIECERCHSYPEEKNNMRRAETKNKVDALKTFKKDKFGLIDWVAAIKDGKMKPVAGIDPVFNKDKSEEWVQIFKPRSDFMGDVPFPHDIHSYLIDCDSCHPKPFVAKEGENPNVRMAEMRGGKWCGKCHSKVAFSTADCRRCHTRGAQLAGVQ